MQQIHLPVSALIDQVLVTARQRYGDVSQNWIKVSFRLGSVIPASLLTMNIQRAGELDIVLRSLEDETALKMRNPPDQVDMAFNFQAAMSAGWVSSCYEFLRAIKQRRDELKEENSEEYLSLFADLELIRMPL